MLINKIPNTQSIKKIVMKPLAFTKCEIGQDWYRNDLTITFIPDKCYPDYMQVEDWIMQNIDGQIMNIEDVVKQVRDFLQQEYSPKELQVESKVTGNKVHFDVEVIG